MNIRISFLALGAALTLYACHSTTKSKVTVKDTSAATSDGGSSGSSGDGGSSGAEASSSASGGSQGTAGEAGAPADDGSGGTGGTGGETGASSGGNGSGGDSSAGETGGTGGTAGTAGSGGTGGTPGSGGTGGSGQVSTLWSEDFESGVGDWTMEGGVWAIGEPTYGPSAFGGANVAGTVLSSYYPTNSNARLVSPVVTLPAASENPRLRYVYFMESEPGVDFGQLQIRVGGAWEDVEGERVSGFGNPWTQRIVDLTPYAGEMVRFGFSFVADYSVSLAGWYLDDLAVETGALPEFDGFEDFESGFGDWSVEGGVWAIGEPTYDDGPTAANGTRVAGTVLDTYYLSSIEARLVSPHFDVPPVGEEPRLRFSAWYDTEQGFDYAQVQVKAGGSWQDVGSTISGSGRNWSALSVDLSSYAGQNVQVGFLFVSDIGVSLAGMYIDDVELLSGT